MADELLAELGASPDLEVTVPVEATQVAPTAATAVHEAPPSPDGPARPPIRWGVVALRGGVLVAGVVLGLALPPLAVVLVTAVGVITAAALRLGVVERAPGHRLLVGPGTVLLASLLCAGAALSTVFGVIGAALVVRSQVLTADGEEIVPSVDMIHLHDRHSEALGAFRTFALERWNKSSIVTAPNLDVVEAGMIRQSGFRATKSAFNLAIIDEPAERLTKEIASSNLEVF